MEYFALQAGEGDGSVTPYYRTVPLSSELSSEFDVRDPVLAVLLDVQRGRIGALTALYRVRALVAGGWRS